MAREPMDVWLYGTHIASITEGSRQRMSLRWTEQALERWGPGAHVLSAKLQIGTTPSDVVVQAYVDGLLPEGNARVNQAMSAGIAPDDTYALIGALGRDTPGAAIFVPTGAGDPTRAGHYEPLTDDEVQERLRRADEHAPAQPGVVHESSTLPGMVPKITLHREHGSWHACKDGAPSTWILKRGGRLTDDGGDIIDTEVACLALARVVRLTTVAAEVLDFGEVRGIAVSRYDRDGHLGREHQEDLAQAIGLSTSDPNRKFQWGSAMPSLRDAAMVLRDGGANQDPLLRLVAFSLLVGNTDLHAKNISFLRHADGSVQLSPAYDVAMHLHHRPDDRRNALDINGKFIVDEITVDDVVAEGVGWGLPVRRARRVVSDTIEAVRGALVEIDRSAHPNVSEQAWAVVDRRTQEAADRLPASTGVTTRRAPARERVGSKRRGPKRPRPS